MRCARLARCEPEEGRPLPDQRPEAEAEALSARPVGKGGDGSGAHPGGLARTNDER